MWLVDIMYSLCLGIGALNVIGHNRSHEQPTILCDRSGNDDKFIFCDLL